MRFRGQAASNLAALAIVSAVLVGCGILPQQKRIEIIYAEALGAEGGFACNPGSGERICYNTHHGPPFTSGDSALSKLFEEKPMRYCAHQFSYIACSDTSECLIVQLDAAGDVSAFSYFADQVYVAVGSKKLKPVMSSLDNVDWSQSNCKTPVDLPLK